MNIGAELKKHRTRLELSQRQLADKVGISRMTYQNYEENKSRPPLEKVEALANVFNVTPESLIGWETLRRKLTDKLTTITAVERYFGASASELINLLDQLNPKGVDRLLELAEQRLVFPDYCKEGEL